MELLNKISIVYLHFKKKLKQRYNKDQLSNFKVSIILIKVFIY